MYRTYECRCRAWRGIRYQRDHHVQGAIPALWPRPVNLLRFQGTSTKVWAQNLSAPFQTHWIVNGAIAILATGMLALAGYVCLDAYTDYRAYRALAAADDIAAAAFTASEYYAAERGLTAALLGAPAGADPAARARLAGYRRAADTSWQEASAGARAHAPASAVGRALQAAQATRDDLEALRRRADAALDTGSVAAADPARWLAASTRFIETLVALGRDALYGHDLPAELARAYALRQNVWAVSEYAGRERGWLAYYLAAPRPPQAVREQLRVFRGMTLIAAGELERRAADPAIEPAVRAAVADMRKRYLEDFEPVRARAHAALAAGGPAFGGLEWVERATQAIGSILAVSGAVAAQSRRQLAGLRRSSLWRLSGGIALLILSLGAAFASLTRVRGLVNQMFREKELVQVTMDSIGDAVITTDLALRVEYLNPVAEALTGWTLGEARGRPLREVFNIVNGYNREPRESPVERCLRKGHVVGLGNDTVLIRRDGAETTIEDSAAPVRDRQGDIVGAVMVFYDVAASRGNTHLLSYHATHDRLTGLANRVEFERRLKGALEEIRSRGGQHTICVLDLDQFRVVNDTGGHAAGDQLLRQLTRQLQARARDSDTLAHFGGDEFGLLLISCPLDKAVAVADNLLQLVRDFRFEWRGSTFNLSASIGVVPITPAETDAGEVLAKADAACFAAKEKGRNRLQVYEPGDLEYAYRHSEMQWVSRLTRALEQDLFVLYAQPIQPITPQGVLHFEVLVRLREDGRLTPPVDFIPAAERYGLMPRIDRWILRHALAAFARHRADGAADGRVCSINVSGGSLGDREFLELLRVELKTHALPAGSLCFEITETAAVTNMDLAVRFIEELRALGCRFALDDFGTGLCSFGYLKQLKVDYLKIGGTFVKDIEHDATASATVQAINTIGHTLGMHTIAEHVANPEILRQVTAMGVDYVQGYVLAEPRPLDAFLGLGATVGEFKSK